MRRDASRRAFSRNAHRIDIKSPLLQKILLAVFVVFFLASFLGVTTASRKSGRFLRFIEGIFEGDLVSVGLIILMVAAGLWSYLKKKA